MLINEFTGASRRNIYKGSESDMTGCRAADVPIVAWFLQLPRTHTYSAPGCPNGQLFPCFCLSILLYLNVIAISLMDLLSVFFGRSVYAVNRSQGVAKTSLCFVKYMKMFIPIDQTHKRYKYACVLELLEGANEFRATECQWISYLNDN